MKKDVQNNPGFVRHIPNILTIARLAITVVFLGLIMYAPTTGKEKPADVLLMTFILFIIAGLTDIVDGHIARRFNATSQFGRMVDPLADKILVCGAFICFAIIGQPKLTCFGFSENTLHIIHWTTAAVLLIREVFVQTLRHIAESRGINFAAVSWGKIKMFLQSFGIGTTLIGWAYVSRPWGDWLTLFIYFILVVFTVFSGIQSLKRPIQ